MILSVDINNDYALSNSNTKINNCDYLFAEPYNNSNNKYLYDRWVATLILSVFIIALHLVLAIFGILVFVDVEIDKVIGRDNEVERVIEILARKNKNKC